jgi:hypothetical protein
LAFEAPTNLQKSHIIQHNDRGEPTISYKWTGWSSRVQENYRSF